MAWTLWTWLALLNKSPRLLQVQQYGNVNKCWSRRWDNRSAKRRIDVIAIWRGEGGETLVAQLASANVRPLKTKKLSKNRQLKKETPVELNGCAHQYGFDDSLADNQSHHHRQRKSAPFLSQKLTRSNWAATHFLDLVRLVSLSQLYILSRPSDPTSCVWTCNKARSCRISYISVPCWYETLWIVFAAFVIITLIFMLMTTRIQKVPLNRHWN